MRKVPELRFAGFDGEWEISRLGKISSKITKGTTPKEYGNGTVNFIKLENINSTGNICPMTTISSDIHEGALSRSILKENDILLSIAGALGRVGIVKNNILPANTNQALSIIRLFESYNAIFVLYYLSNGMLDKEINKIATIGAQPNISLSQVGDFKINLPESLEQEKIGNLFRKIDALIEIQEGKVSKMEDFKKSMLQKMFPKKDELVPEFRFDGFEGGWNTKALGDLSEISTGKLDANAMVPGGEYDFYTSGIEKYKIDNYAFEGPSITVAGNGATVGYMHLADGKFNAYQRTYVIQKIKGDRIFIFYQIQSKLPRKIHEESRQGNIPYIVMNMLTDLYLDVPEIEEQEKIGQFFKNLDTQIENEEKLLESYKCMKKSLLQKMFV